MRKLSRKAKLMIGLMSGTSADGIDAVLAEVWQQGGLPRARLLQHVHTPFPGPLSRRILAAALEGHVAEICELNFILGEEFARAALTLLSRSGVKPEQVLGIGSHGQTVHHLPRAKVPSTLQIGESSVIAERTGITTVADFRTRDMAVGGQGAPLVPFADYVLFADSETPRIVQNIGGIGNLTFLPRNPRWEEVIAFDTGPGNMIMDACAHAATKGRLAYDKDGKLAAAGKVCEPLLRELLRHPFLRRVPPKTTGREEFGGAYVKAILARARQFKLSPQDLLATVTAFTADTIALAFRRFIFPSLSRKDLSSLQVILGGGGALNPVLRNFLQARLGVGRLWTHEDFGVPNEAKEALAFALLGYQTLHGRPSNVPNATGASRPAVLGKITPGHRVSARAFLL